MKNRRIGIQVNTHTLLCHSYFNMYVYTKGVVLIGPVRSDDIILLSMLCPTGTYSTRARAMKAAWSLLGC